MKTPIIIGIKIALDVWINLRRYVYITVLKKSRNKSILGLFFFFAFLCKVSHPHPHPRSLEF